MKLALAKFIYNNNIYSFTKVILFFALYSYYLQIDININKTIPNSILVIAYNRANIL